MDSGRRTRVLLLSMPFGAIDRPALGLSLLKPALAVRGFVCDVRYLNFVFADYAGGNEYRWAMNDLPYTAFAGDWTFTESLYGVDAGRDDDYIETILRETWNRGDHDVARLRNLRELVEPFLAACLASVPFGDYDVVGFTSTFEQNIASLSFARRIKELFPAILTVFGGANWEVPMGLALHQRFPFVDYVCSGEADESFPNLIEQIDRFGDDFAPPAGVVARRGGESVFGGPAPLVRAMDDLPVPDFSDYFRDLELSGSGVDAAPSILFESSRGCWWGAKHHCTFCGLNFETMDFRRRPPERVLAEIEELVARWGAKRISFTDNIMPLDYVRSLFPALEALPSRPKLFYEVKANLKEEQLDAMTGGGVDSIQPGIESLSSHTLALMRKGVNALQNVALLRSCRGRRIHVVWSHLYGFPGERPDDYRSVLRLIPKIEHLEPPGLAQRISIDRYSPYHADPERLGVGRLTPFRNYGGLYPREAPLDDLAYHFTADYSTDFMEDRALLSAFHDGIALWRSRWRAEQPILHLIDRGGAQVAVADTRSLSRARLTTLSRAAERTLRHFERPRPRAGVHPPQISAEIDALLERHFLVEHEEMLISVVVRLPEGAKDVATIRDAA